MNILDLVWIPIKVEVEGEFEVSKRIGQLKIGESGFCSPSAYDPWENDLRLIYTVYPSPNHTNRMYIERTGWRSFKVVVPDGHVYE